jgi:hypothetical protein
MLAPPAVLGVALRIESTGTLGVAPRPAPPGVLDIVLRPALCAANVERGVDSMLDGAPPAPAMPGT